MGTGAMSRALAHWGEWREWARVTRQSILGRFFTVVEQPARAGFADEPSVAEEEEKRLQNAGAADSASAARSSIGQLHRQEMLEVQVLPAWVEVPRDRIEFGNLGRQLQNLLRFFRGPILQTAVGQEGLHKIALG